MNTPSKVLVWNVFKQIEAYEKVTSNIFELNNYCRKNYLRRFSKGALPTHWTIYIPWRRTANQKVKPKLADMGHLWTSVSGPHVATLDVSLRWPAESETDVHAKGLHVGHVWLHFFVRWLMAVGLLSSRYIYSSMYQPRTQGLISAHRRRPQTHTHAR